MESAQGINKGIALGACEWHVGKTIVLAGNDARAQGSAAGTRKPSYFKESHT